MPSFLQNLQAGLSKFGHGLQVGLGIEQQAAPLINLIPGGSVVNTVVTGIIALEQLFPQAGLGAAKAQLVTAAASAVAPGIDPATTQQSISQIVAAFNALSAAAHPAAKTTP